MQQTTLQSNVSWQRTKSTDYEISAHRQTAAPTHQGALNPKRESHRSSPAFTVANANSPGSLIHRSIEANSTVHSPHKAERLERNVVSESKALSEQLLNDWNSSEQKVLHLVKKIAPGSRPLVELQMAFNQLQIKSQVALKCAETAAGTARQVQQLGNG